MTVQSMPKIALVLGASSGLGLASLKSLAQDGYIIRGVHFDIGDKAEGVSSIADDLRAQGSNVKFYNMNAAAIDTREYVIDDIGQEFGENCIDMLVHSLSFGALLPFLKADQVAAVDKRRIEMTLDVMANSLLYWCQDVFSAKLFADCAKIIAFTSAGSARVTSGYGAVSAAKSALESHVRQLALEFAPHGISVNALRAGVTRTDSFDKIPNAQAIAERVLAFNPHKRLTTPQDVASAVCLLSKMSTSWITGNVINVDGGEFLTA